MGERRTHTRITDNGGMAETTTRYRERLWPSAVMFIITAVFLIPAVTLVLTPIDAAIALPGAIIVYAIVFAILASLSPTVRVENGTLTAGRAHIPVSLLGEPELIGREELRRAIGIDLDARAHLVVRGWIREGLRIPNLDAQDPAPYWIITSRKPQALAAALRAG